MTIPPEAITAAWSTLLDVPGWPPYMARAADYPDIAALRAADEEAAEQNEAVIRRLLEAAAPLIAAAERDRCVKIVNDLADHYDNIEMHAWADEHRKIADLLTDDPPSSRPGHDIHLASWGPVLDSPWKADPENDQP
jgi:hypothetical protein